MLRQIVKPTQNTLTLQLPDDLIGKTVEVIAFELEERSSATADKRYNRRIEDIAELFDQYRVDLSSFKFNRDEANDYDSY